MGVYLVFKVNGGYVYTVSHNSARVHTIDWFSKTRSVNSADPRGSIASVVNFMFMRNASSAKTKLLEIWFIT